MIICRTPFHLSFFGRGVDRPNWYDEHGSRTLGATIDKYCYISCRYLPPFFHHRYSLVYSAIETCNSVDEIKHPAVKAVLRFLRFDRGLEIHHDGDLPARGGLGTSSSFTVGLLNAVLALQGKMAESTQLARDSIHIEQNLLHENVGAQDQIFAAYGGFNELVFHRGGEFEVRPLNLDGSRVATFNHHLMLFYTRVLGVAPAQVPDDIDNLRRHAASVARIEQLSTQGAAILRNGTDLEEFGDLLHQCWRLEEEAGIRFPPPHIRALYDAARQAGARGGKLTGRGGGFLLLFVPPSHQPRVRQVLSDLLYIPFKFEFGGSNIIFFDQEDEFTELADCDGALEPSQSALARP